jgi:sortase (surface protein transpeptidase)
VRTVVRTIGEVLITLGLVVLLFVVYEVYWTDLISAGKQRDATSVLDNEWKQKTDDPQRQDHFTGLGEGDGFAKMYIPSFGADYHFTVVEGTTAASLEIGPGHYTHTAYPGEAGNFAVAGHRVGKGAPFNDINLIGSCDAIVVETQNNWFVYRALPKEEEKAGWAENKGKEAKCKGVSVLGGPYKNVVGQQIVTPSDGLVVAPVPGSSTAPSTGEHDAHDLPSPVLRQAAPDRARGAGQAVGEGPGQAELDAAGAEGDVLMYAWIWQHLPGPFAVRLTLAIALVLGFVALLMFVVFPWAEPLLPFNNVTTPQ